LPHLWRDPVDHLLALDPGARGIDGFFQPGAAARAAHALQRAERVVITTGFVVDSGTAETDGPPGAAVLGRALRTLGAEVRYVVEEVTAPVLSAALDALGEPADVVRFPSSPDAAREVLARERPSHLVAIERPGRARDGSYRNMRGVDVSEWNAPLDQLFIEAHKRSRGPRYNKSRFDRAQRDVITIGVGDGGNEVGMGNVRARFARGNALAASIGSVVRADHLVVAGVSNWGAYGMVAHLARLAGRPLLHAPDDERRLVVACVKAGACDGVTRRREATVDGLALDAHAAIVALLGVAAFARA